MLIYQRGKNEYKGNLHAHTTESDGAYTPEEVIRAYKDAGYDFLAITDHRKITTAQETDLVMIPGMELDFTVTDSEVIHLLVLGVSDSFQAVYERNMTAQEAVRFLKEKGSLVFLAHPHWSLNRANTVKSLDGIDGVEIFNSISRPPYNAQRADATQILDLLACDGRLYPTLATDDSHFYDAELFGGFIYAAADSLDEQGILTALREGRYYASQGPRFERVEVVGDKILVSCSEVSTIMFNSNLPWNNNRCAAGEGITKGEYLLNRRQGERFVRVVIEDQNGKKAWMNPFAV